MRRCECFYCGGKEEGAVLIDWLFGIKVCGVHRPNAERDCRAYLYRENFVRINDAMNYPIIKRFLNVLADHPLLLVERTNGTIDDDWCLRLGSPMEAAFFSKAERWGVPLYNKRLNLNKTVPIINFLRPDLTTGMVLPADWSAVIEGVLDILNEGVYKADAEAYDYARNHDDSETIAETAGVATVIYEGREERIFIGHLGQYRLRENGTDRIDDPS